MDVIPLSLFVKLFICLFIYAMAKIGNLDINLDKGVTRTKNLTITVPEQVRLHFRFYFPTRSTYVVSSELEVEDLEKQRALSMPLCNK